MKGKLTLPLASCLMTRSTQIIQFQPIHF